MNPSNMSRQFSQNSENKGEEQTKLLFEKIKEYFQIKHETVPIGRTLEGKTQFAGKKAEAIVEAILIDLGLTYSRAGTQQSKDFRNVGGIGLNIEVKKTDCNTVIMNDTRPNENIYYIIFCTAEKVKRKKPTILFKNGKELINAEYPDEIMKALKIIDEQRELLKQSIKDNKTSLGNLRMTTRIRHDIDISKFY